MKVWLWRVSEKEEQQLNTLNPEVNCKFLLENDLQRKGSNSERMDLQRVENSNSNSIAVLSAGRVCGWDDRSISLKIIPIRLRPIASRGDQNRSYLPRLEALALNYT